jgi:hypothetical protein
MIQLPFEVASESGSYRFEGHRASEIAINMMVILLFYSAIDTTPG